MRFYPDAVQAFINDPASNLQTPVSKKTYRETLASLHGMFPEKRTVKEFTEEDLVRFANRSELAPYTRSAYRARLTAFFDWAAWKGIIPKSPAANLKRLMPTKTTPTRQATWLSSREIENMLAQLPQDTILELRDLVIARLGFTMGLRRAEIAGLRWNQVDLDRAAVHLKGKGRKQATTYIPPRTVEVLAKWKGIAQEHLGREPVDEHVIPAMQHLHDFQGNWETRVLWDRGVMPPRVGQLFHRAAEKVGYTMSAHDMRRSFAGALKEQGFTMEEIQEALRHSNLGVTQRYLESRQDAAYQAVKRRGFDL